jgi:hypothetical protein
MVAYAHPKDARPRLWSANGGIIGSWSELEYRQSGTIQSCTDLASAAKTWKFGIGNGIRKLLLGERC